MLRHLSEAEGDTPDSYCLLNGKMLGAKWEIGDIIRDIKGGTVCDRFGATLRG